MITICILLFSVMIKHAGHNNYRIVNRLSCFFLGGGRGGGKSGGGALYLMSPMSNTRYLYIVGE